MSDKKHVGRLLLIALMAAMATGGMAGMPAQTQAGSPDKLTVSDCWRLMDEGRKLTVEQSAELEAKLEKDPQDIRTRLRLLGRPHGEAMSPAGVKLLIGLIENHPRSQIAGPICMVLSAFEGKAGQQCLDLWEKFVTANPDDPRVLGNAAMWMEHFGMFEVKYRSRAKVLFEKAHTFEPQNPEWLEHLARGSLLDAGDPKELAELSELTPEERVAAAKKAIEQFEAALRLRPELNPTTYRPLDQNYHAVLAGASLLAGQTNQARAYAIKLLETLDQKTERWNYGNLIFRFNLLLGQIALQEGNADAVAKYLLAAGKTPGSPQLNSFGPDFSLAGALLRHGRPEDRTAVLQFLDEVAVFWANPDKETYTLYKEATVKKRQQLEAWKKDIDAGKIPEDRRWHDVKRGE
jgi:hypothetical protein